MSGGGFWAVFWIAVVMKIPVALLLYLVWYAIKDPPGANVDGPGHGGSDRDPWPHPGGRPPQPPRRGPHRSPEPVPPRRTRIGTGRSKTVRRLRTR